MCAMACVVLMVSVRRSTEASLKRAAQFLQRGEAERARVELQWPLWLNPRHPAALQLTGLSYLRQKKWTSAIASLERIPDDSPLHADSQINLAGALLADRQFERTEVVLRQYLEHDPGSIVANRLLSGLFLTELRPREAVDVLEQLVQYQANQKLPLEEILLILRDLSTAEFHPPSAAECLPTLKEALERDPDQASVRLAVGQCLADAGDLQAAETLMRRALQQRPDDFRIRFVVSEFLLDAGDADAAASALLGGENHARNPNANEQSSVEKDYRYWVVRSRIAEHRGDFTQALIEQDRAATLQAEGKEELARRGRLLQRLNPPEAARDALARAHDWARAELDLWNLSRDVGTRMPTLGECEKIASLYEALGKPHQSAAWRQLAVQIQQEQRPRQDAI